MRDVQNAGIILGVVLTGLGIIAALWKGGRAVARFMRRVYDFLDQWNGEPARDGEPARAGVPARLAALEVGQRETRAAVQQVRTEVQQVKGELKPNGGTTLRDGLNRIEEHLGTQQSPPER